MRVLLINADFIQASGLIRWLTPIACVTLAETADEVIARLDRGESVDRVVVCAGAEPAFAGGFHRALMRRHDYMATRLLYVSQLPLPPWIAHGGATTVTAAKVTPTQLSRHLRDRPTVADS